MKILKRDKPRNTPFLWIDKRFVFRGKPVEASFLAELSCVAIKVYVVLSAVESWDVVSINHLCQFTNLARRSVHNALHELQSKELIWLASGQMAGQCNSYRVLEWDERGVQSTSHPGVQLDAQGCEAQVTGGMQSTSHNENYSKKTPPKEGDKQSLHPCHNDFMGAWRRGHTTYHGKSPDAEHMKKIGRQFKDIIYSEFSWVNSEFVLLCIRRFWLPVAQQSKREQNAVKQSRTIKALGFLIRMETESKVEHEAFERGWIHRRESDRKAIEEERARIAKLKAENPEAWALEILPKTAFDGTQFYPLYDKLESGNKISLLALRAVINHRYYFEEQKEAAMWMLKKLEAQ